jgi:hypothetical protein
LQTLYLNNNPALRVDPLSIILPSKPVIVMDESINEDDEVVSSVKSSFYDKHLESKKSAAASDSSWNGQNGEINETMHEIVSVGAQALNRLKSPRAQNEHSDEGDDDDDDDDQDQDLCFYEYDVKRSVATTSGQKISFKPTASTHIDLKTTSSGRISFTTRYRFDNVKVDLADFDGEKRILSGRRASSKTRLIEYQGDDGTQMKLVHKNIKNWN